MSAQQQPLTRHHPSLIFNNKASWEGIRIEHGRMPSGKSVEHRHEEHQIAIILEGTFTAETQSSNGCSRIGTRTAGHTCVIPSGQSYLLRSNEEMEYLSIYIEPAMLSRAASDSSVPERVELIEACSAADPLIRQIGMALKREGEAERPAGRLYAESLANLLTVHLLRHYTNNGGSAKQAQGGLSGHRLRRATEFIHENLERDLALAEIAEAVELSPFHFARAFKQATGLTPHQYVIKNRIERAKTLLADDELPLVEVSYRAGFKNQSHFTTLFRRLTSLTPKAYRDSRLIGRIIKK
jgi:AraC family transcriptional regulator